MADFKVQRGVTSIDLSPNPTVVTLGEAVGSLTAAFARITNVARTSGGINVGDSQNLAVDDYSCMIELTSTTQISIEKVPTGIGSSFRVYWEVIEYIGAGGGANEFIVRKQDREDMTTGTTGTPPDVFKNIAITGVSVQADLVPFVTGIYGEATNRQYAKHACMASIIATDTLKLEVPSTQQKVSYAVVEFTGSNWTIQQNIAHTISAVATNEAEIITAVVLADAFITGGFKSADLTSNPFNLNEALLMWWFKDTNEIFFRQEGGTAHLEGIVHVVENSELTVQHLDSVLGGETDLPAGTADPQTETRTVTAVASLAEASLFGSGVDTHTLEGYPSMAWNYRLTNTTTIEFWRSRHEDVAQWAQQVVQWPVGGAALVKVIDEDVQS